MTRRPQRPQAQRRCWPALATLIAAAAAAPGLALAQGATAAPEAAAIQSPHAGLTLGLRTELNQAAPGNPLAQAEKALPGIAPASPVAWLAELGWQPPALALAPGLNLGMNLLAWHRHNPTTGHRTGLRANELQVSGETAAGAFNIGKLEVAWDVGQGFRPNDLVQQAQRRNPLSSPLEGRPLLQWETFGADTATSLVWVNPQHHQHSFAAAPGPEESALAWRHYRRLGQGDLHGFARWGRHSGASLGAAGVWVASDSLALHSSVRQMQHASAWVGPRPAADAVLTQSPWQPGLSGSGRQALVGGTWTGASQQTLLAEAWFDGNALPADQWRAWSARNTALATLAARPPPGLPAAAIAANLAWQATPWAGNNLHQQSLFVRAAWQPDRWTHSLDLLWHPADSGRAVTATSDWQGERWRLQAGLRHLAGPSAAVLKQLPQRTSLLLAATAHL